jgi:hypothetical protein
MELDRPDDGGSKNSTRLHGPKTQKTDIFVRTSNPVTEIISFLAQANVVNFMSMPFLLLRR